MRPHIILPTEANLRFYRRIIALSVILAVTTGALGAVLMGAGRHGGSRSPLGLFLGSLVFVVTIVKWRGTLTTLRQQARQLTAYGRRFPVAEARTELMSVGNHNHRHVVVARWHDERGESHEALSDPFDYEPYPLLDPSRITVLADPHEPALCLVASDALPPHKSRLLDAAQRALLSEAGVPDPTLAYRMLWLTVGVLLLGLAYLIAKLVNIRWHFVDWL